MAEKPKNRKQPGPPPSPDARRETFTVKMSKTELEAIEEAGRAAGQPPRVWARDKLLRGLKIATR